jgi:hypothetical protein
MVSRDRDPDRYSLWCFSLPVCIKRMLDESIGNGDCSINGTFPRIDFPTLISEAELQKRLVIAENIRRLITKRIKVGEFSSIEHFASSTGVPKSLLSRLLNLKADPKLSSLDKIAVALEVPVEELLKDKVK